VNVIVGPNAVGKTTIIDSFRMVKAILLPRFQNEAQITLQSLGVLSQHNPSVGGPGMELNLLANNPGLPIEITYTIEINDNEISSLKHSADNLSLMFLQAEMLRGEQDNILAFTQFLSTSAGQKRLSALKLDVEKKISNLTKGSALTIGLRMDGQTGQMRGVDLDSQMMLSALDRSIEPYKSYFNYFPADRALPQGEIPIQLGSHDVQQQLQSYLAQPALKYARLKHTIVQNVMFSDEGRDLIRKEFDHIFDSLLPGKRLDSIQFTPFNALRVLVEDGNSMLMNPLIFAGAEE